MIPMHSDEQMTLWHGDALRVLRELEAGSVDCCVTSPPYFGLRDYGVAGQYGLEETPAQYVEQLRVVFAEVRRVLADDGTLWVNLGDAYAGRANAGPTRDRHRGGGHKAGITTAQRNMLEHAPYKSLLGMPWRVALALIDDGWALRNDVIWTKSNAMPESVSDRLANRHEHAYQTEGRNPGDVWTIATQPFPEAHFATMPPVLAERCILAGCRPGGVVLDPFSGSGTTGLAASRRGRRYVGIDLNRSYLELSLRTRLAQTALIDGGAA